MSDPAPRTTYGPGPDYDQRQKRERIRTVLIGLTIGCALSAMLLFARSAMKPATPAPAPANAPASPTAPANPPSP